MLDIINAGSALLMMALGLFSAAATVNAIRPFRNAALLLPSMLWSWFVLGMLGQTLVLQMLLAAFLIWVGALDFLIGWAGLVVLVFSWIGTVFVMSRA